MKGIEMQPRYLSIITFLLATLSRESANYYSWSWSLVRANRLSNKQQRIEAKLFHRNTMSQQVFVTHVAHPYLSAVYRSVRTCVTVPRVDNKLPVVPNILTWRHLSKAHIKGHVSISETRLQECEQKRFSQEPAAKFSYLVQLHWCLDDMLTAHEKDFSIVSALRSSQLLIWKSLLTSAHFALTTPFALGMRNFWDWSSLISGL